jgi:hypothetical protein
MSHQQSEFEQLKKELALEVFLYVARSKGTYHSDIMKGLGLKNKTLLYSVLHYLADEKKLLGAEYKTVEGASVLAYYVADSSMPIKDLLEVLDVGNLPLHTLDLKSLLSEDGKTGNSKIDLEFYARKRSRKEK